MVEKHGNTGEEDAIQKGAEEKGREGFMLGKVLEGDVLESCGTGGFLLMGLIAVWAGMQRQF